MESPPKADRNVPSRATESTISPERRQSIKALFNSALEIEPEQRNEFLRSACGEDTFLRAEVESLLEAHEEVEVPTAALVAPERAIQPPEDTMAGRRIGPY